MLAWASPALASRGHVFEKTFSEPCLAEPCEGALKEPAGVAVNEATGLVYVVDKGANRVARFSASGAYEAEFNGSGTLSGEGAAAGSRGGEVETGRFEAPEGIAVDNSCKLLGLAEPACKEADPSRGDVYVLDAGHRVIDKYTAGGEYVGQISANAAGRFSEALDGVAVDPHGLVWVYREEKAIDGYSNAVINLPTSTRLVSSLGGFGLPGFAVDSHEHFYVRHNVGEDFVGRIAEVDRTGKILIEEVDNKPSVAVAADQSNDNSFVQNLTTVGVYDPSGKELERLGREKGEEHLGEGAGIGVNAGAGSLYVADAGAKDIVVFGPVQPTAPTVESQSAAEISSAGATLNAEVNPRSEPGEGPTEYHFEYGVCNAPGGCSESGYEASVPVPDGQIAPDFEAHTVSATIVGLKASTTYHFRVLAHNELGPVVGSGASFTTQGPGGELVLPDDRGWELVSPPDKQGALIEPISEVGVLQAAADGSQITYLANSPLEAQPSGAANKSQALSTRSADSWSSRDISLPHVSATGSPIGQGQEYKAFTPDLSLSAVQPFGQFDPLLSDEASESTAYLHDLGEACGSSCFHPLVTGKPGSANVPPGTEFGEAELCTPSATEETTTTHVACGPEFLGASEDLSHILLHAGVALKAGAGGQQLYEWSGGRLTQVSVLPGGGSAPEAPEARLGLHSRIARRAISTDGSRIDWESAASLYQRDTSLEETAQLDEGEGCSGCESGSGQFQIASSDGSRVLFTDTHRLTVGSGAEPGGSHKADLYECRMTLEAGKLHCTLSDLTPARGGEGANVQGQLLGASEDGEYVYFAAEGVQSGANAQGESPQVGRPNLYERHGGTTSFVATLSGGDMHDWGGEEGLVGQPTRVSPNGRFLELMSQASLTGYDNRDAATGQPAAEVYLFDAAGGTLRCASCDPTGARPVGVEYHKLEPGSGGLVGGPRGIWPDTALVAANVPGTTAIALLEFRYQPRYLNNQGRLFFNTANGLVAQDSNNTQDVYEYEPPGVGGASGCSSASESFSARSGGCVNLISSGHFSQESAFLDASESGDDVFFLTAARLSAIDTDSALDIYDAHVCSDSPCIVYPPQSSSQCSGESCQAPLTPQPSIFGAPASATFTGPGNFAPAAPVRPKPKSAEQLRIERLNKALKACRAKANKKRRAVCEKTARKRYAKPAPKAKKKARAKRSRHTVKRGSK